MEGEVRWWYINEKIDILVLHSAFCVLWHLFFYLLFFPFADVYSSLIFQLSLGRLSDPVIFVGLFSQSGNFMNFLNYKSGSPFSSHILKSFKVLEKYNNGTRYLMNLQFQKIFFSCIFVIKYCKGEEGKTSHLESLKPSCKQGLYVSTFWLKRMDT